MEIRDFNENDISEKNKEALQSEVWQTVKKAMKTEILHFTETPEIQHFAMEKVNKNDNVYGVTWGNLVREYLKTAYSEEEIQAEVVSYGITYKVLKRGEVTAFYDADGNTLFDVENTRLAKEYEWIMNTPEEPEKETECQIKKQIEETGEADLKCSGDIDEKCVDCNKAAASEDPASIKQKAKEKLEKELKEAKDKNFAEPVITYLLKRCEEDEGLTQDVVQEHKTWKKCFDYIYEKARKQAKGNCAAVRDDVVYEWAEDYYHKDDKADEEEKAKKEAEAKAKREKAAAEKKASGNNKTVKAGKKASDNKSKIPLPVKEEKPKEQTKPNKKEMEGQLDMFSMMGM